jgi:hypothetical protein
MKYKQIDVEGRPILDERLTTRLTPESIEQMRNGYQVGKLFDAETWPKSGADQSIQLDVKFKRFDPDQHTITLIPGCTDAYLINGKAMHGTDGNVPEKTLCEIERLEVTWNGKSFLVPSYAHADCYYAFAGHMEGARVWSVNNSNPESQQVHERIFYTSPDGHILKIQCSGGDGAGSYEVVWLLDREGYIGRYFGTVMP